MTVLRCPRCNRLWAHNCGPSSRFAAIGRICPECIADVYPRVA